jgi:hypothetical protein
LKSPSDGKELLLEFPYNTISFTQHLNVGQKDRDAPANRQYLLAFWGLDLHVEGGHPLVICEAKHFGKKAKPLLSALQYNLFCVRIDDIEAIGSFENFNMLLYEKEVLINRRVHIRFVLEEWLLKLNLES